MPSSTPRVKQWASNWLCKLCACGRGESFIVVPPQWIHYSRLIGLLKSVPQLLPDFALLSSPSPAWLTGPNCECMACAVVRLTLAPSQDASAFGLISTGLTRGRLALQHKAFRPVNPFNPVSVRPQSQSDSTLLRRNVPEHAC